MEFTDRKFGITLLMPAVLMAALLFVYPIAFSLYMSFHYKDPFSRESAPFVGLENFQILLDEPEFWIGVKNGLIFSCSTVSLQLIIGISLSLLLNLKFKGRSFARGLVLLPYIVPTVGVVLMWRWLYDDLLGIVNRLLLFLGIIDESIAWLGNMKWTMVAVIIVAVWRMFPFVVICVLARLQTIPEDLYDAARVDGANAFQRFRDITIPQLRHILFVVVLLRFVWMFNEFEIIWLLTQGGPVDRTTTMPVFAYLTAFRNYELSPGMAVTIIMMAFLIIIALIFFKIYNVEEEI